MKKIPLIIQGREIGMDQAPFVIAEIGINHEGDMTKAKKMVLDAKNSGAECVKFQSHVIADEMVPSAQSVIPGNTTESIWDIMVRCAFSEDQERELQDYAQSLDLIYLSTPFSRAAADRLERLNIPAYKIGSGECNNYPLIKHIASFGKPIILSTGMNNFDSIRPSVDIIRSYNIPFALLHCTSIYPTPYAQVRLGALAGIKKEFPDAEIGLSDHSVGNYTCFGATALGARILEKHFTSDKSWPGPDIEISIDPTELRELVVGTEAIYLASGGKKTILPEEQSTINFAYASVVTTKRIEKGTLLSHDNIWVKRPGTGDFLAKDFDSLIGKKVEEDIEENQQIRKSHLISA